MATAASLCASRDLASSLASGRPWSAEDDLHCFPAPPELGCSRTGAAVPGHAGDRRDCDNKSTSATLPRAEDGGRADVVKFTEGKGQRRSQISKRHPRSRTDHS